MPSLQQRLTENSPATSGIHEAMAQHAEDTFDSLKGILPLFLGKRNSGPFVVLTLPNQTMRSRASLLSALSDLIIAYDFRLVSFVSAIQARTSEDDDPKLGAILVTADNAKALFQLPWELDFDAESNLTGYRRSEADGEIIPAASWNAFFQRSSPEARRPAYERLVNLFEDASQLPAFDE
jgi:hypothetical protein